MTPDFTEEYNALLIKKDANAAFTVNGLANNVGVVDAVGQNEAKSTLPSISPTGNFMLNGNNFVVDSVNSIITSPTVQSILNSNQIALKDGTALTYTISNSTTVAPAVNAAITLTSGTNPITPGIQLRFSVGGDSSGDGGEINFNYTALNTANLSPQSGKTIDLGTSARRYSTIYLINTPDVSSDRRLKTDIQDLNYGLEEIDRLQPRRFKMFGKEMIGFVAQEVSEVLPEIASDGKEEMASYRPMDLIPILVKAVQELSLKVKKLEERVII